MFSFINRARIACVTFVAFVLFPVLFAAPAAPAGLSATNLKATSFTLKWTASTGAVGYDVQRDGVLLGSTATRSLAVTGLAPLTTYSMTVIARDGAGDVSPTSAPLPVTTPADTTKPTRPTALVATDITTTSFTLSWSGSTDDVGVTGYTIYRAGTPLGSSLVTAFEVSGLAPDKNHRMTVRAIDAAGNLSASSTALAVRTLANPPSTPIGLTAANLKATSFTLKWNASTGGTGGIAGYDVYRDGTLIGSTASRSLAVGGLVPVTAYALTVAARDTVDHVSAPSAALTVTTPPDTTKPTAPANLSATSVTASSFSLGWAASSDNVGVAGYDIYRNGALFGSTPNTTLGITGLAPSSVYSMKLKARDAAGNVSAFSAVLSVTTSAAPNVPPTITLTAPSDGATFTLPAALTLSATATDTDGTVAKVGFYDGTAKLGEVTAPTTPPSTFSFPFIFASPGQHALIARAIDDHNATTDSTPVNIRLLSGLPYLADFEATEGYSPGLVGNQQGWVVANGTVLIATGDAAHGEQSMILGGGTTAGLVGQEFGLRESDPPVVFVDFWIKPVADADPVNGTTFDFDSARLTFVLDSSGDGNATPVARFFALVPDGVGGETWAPLPPRIPLGATHGALEWQRVSLRLDYIARTWDACLNGHLVATDLGFRPESASRFTSAFFRGHPGANTGLDDLYIGADNPLFADADQDGMDDAWEVAHGLDPGINDRNADFDGDGLSNIQEFLLGTNPSAVDSDHDGSSDSQELAFGTDPTRADSDGDGLPDGWELNHNLDPLSDADAALDPDGDGLTNFQEYTAGSEPMDYYNDVLPEITSLLAADGSLGEGDTLSVRIADPSGNPLPNAPVSFASVMGEHRLAATPDEPGDFNITVNTDAAGIARVFLKPRRSGNGE